MAKGKFSKPRSSRDDNALPMEPEIPGLSEDLAQELLLDELTQDASAWGEVTDQPEEEPEVVVVLPAEPQPEPQEPEESAPEAETPEEVAAEPVILPEEPEEIPAREEIPAEPVTEMFILPEDPDETAVLPGTEEPEDFSEPEEPEVSPKIKKHKKIAMISLCCAALLILGGIVIGAVSASWISVKTIFNVMRLRVRKGDMIEIILDGGAEEEDSQRLTEFAQLNL